LKFKINFANKNNLIDSSSTTNKSDVEMLRGLIDKGILEIKPSIERANVDYPEIKDYFKENDFTSLKFNLDSLMNKGLLKEKSQDRILFCPQCNSPDVHSKFSCPKCNSHNVELTNLIEHTTCGYIGPLLDFAQQDRLICPRCNSNINTQDKNYRNIGNFYHCEKCDYRFDKPEVIHVCQNCGKNSTFKEVKYIRVSTYRVSDDIVSQYMSELPSLESLRLYLANHGYTVKLHGELRGASGTMSHFDLIAEKNNIILVIDTSLQGNKSDIVTFLTKKIDVNPTKALLLDLSDGTELTALGKIYGIDVWKVKDDPLSKELQNLVEKLDSS
jgi:hypothetical protein